jgi:excisionase family DNA binding protein
MRVLRAHDVLPEPPLPDDDPLLTIAQVAHELRCSKGHVQNLIRGRVARTRPLPSVPLGRRRLVRFASLREWIHANEQNH